MAGAGTLPLSDSGVIMASGDERNPMKAALGVMSIGIEMAVAVGVGWAIGSWLDSRFGTSPWLMYLFLALGIAAAFRGLWRTARKYWNDEGD